MKHYIIHQHNEIETENYLPSKDVVNIILTSGASCPDAVVEAVLRKIHSFFPTAADVDETVEIFLKT